MSPTQNAPSGGAVEANDNRVPHLSGKQTPHQLYAKIEGRLVPVSLMDARRAADRYEIFHDVTGWLVAVLDGETPDEQLRRITMKFPLRCTALVDAGWGCHAYWRTEGLSLNSAQAIEAAIGRRLGANPSALNVNRVLRTPGSVSWERGGNGKPVCLPWEDRSRVYSANDFVVALCKGDRGHEGSGAA